VSYRKLFDPEVLKLTAPKAGPSRRAFVADYEYDDAIVLAVNVALATGRPLLLRGDPGSGKSTLAEDVARLMRRRYYEQVISSNIEVADVLWRIDHVSRIADAQAHLPKADLRSYVKPGLLFWAFDRDEASKLDTLDPELRSWDLAAPSETPAVMLIDEIDKAEPDFPNDLLVPLGALSFRVRAAGVDILVSAKEALRPLVIVTTNEERDLPAAFLRRCIVLRLSAPERSRLIKITRRHFSEKDLDDKTLEDLLARYFELRESAAKLKLRAPGTAELLDAARALVGLRGTREEFLSKTSWEFRELTEAALWKSRQAPTATP
jgi:MoxR-like ATPase